MGPEKILEDWKKNKFNPIYWLEGEEDYFIDELMKYAEHHILPENEASFNLTVFYGRDTSWSDILNACRRYPMFSERQVVLLKEAQFMKEIEKLESYIENPLASTIFIVGYKGKEFDKRTKLHKSIKQHAVLFTSHKLKDDKVPAWITNLVKEKGYNIEPKAVSLLYDHIGNDLSRIANEIDKLSVNLKDKSGIDEDDIEKFTGISKEYNIFELSAAISRKDLGKAIKILTYFEANPKAAPIQMALPALYAQLSKVYAAFGISNADSLKQHFYFNPIALQQGQEMMKNYGFEGVQKMLLLLHHYNLKSVGIEDNGTPGPALMKEMITKMMIS